MFARNFFGLALVSWSLHLGNLHAAVEDSRRGFDANVGAAYEFGKLGNSGMNLPDRSMTALSLESLAGYRLNSLWLIGLDFDYRWQQQQTSLSAAGGTNLAGLGWLLGLGANYQFHRQWAVQAAMDFVGRYQFKKQTDASEDDHLQGPITLRAKLQYLPRADWPLSLDLGAEYLSWSTFHVGDQDHSQPSRQWMLGVGVTYHFGAIRARSSAPMEIATVISPPVPPSAPKTPSDDGTLAPAPAPIKHVETQEQELKKSLATEKVEGGLKIKLETAAFDSGVAKLNAEFEAKMKEVGLVLAKSPNQKISVDGYTDASGSVSTNERLSQERADSVRSVLISAGIAASRISAKGHGPANSVATNETPEGRAQNRRVEIRIED